MPIDDNNFFTLDANAPPSKPLDSSIESSDKDTIPIFEWLTSLDNETDSLTYEIAIYNRYNGNPIGSAMVSGMDLPSSILQQLRSYGINSMSAISALYSMSAYVMATWLSGLSDGSYGMKVRAYDGELYSDWSDDLFFYIDVINPPDLFLVPKHSKIEVNWTDPSDSVFQKTVIAFSVFGYPNLQSEYLQGEIVEDDGPPGHSGMFVHNNLTNGVRYYYTAVSYDVDGNMVATQRSAIPIPATSIKNFNVVPRESKIALMWDNPTAIDFPNFNGVHIRYSNAGYPLTTADGEFLFEGMANYYIHDNLIDGTRYYYSIWTVDTFGEYIEPHVTGTEVPVDITAPTGHITINKGDAVTYTTYVDLDIIGTDIGSYVNQMMVSNYADFRDGRWESYSRKKEWVLLYVEGVSSVYVKLQDAFNNVSDVVSASIDLRFDWINQIKTTKSAIKGLSDSSRYGAGLVTVSDNFIGLWADGVQSDLFINRRKIKTFSGNGQLVVDGKIVSIYKYYSS